MALRLNVALVAGQEAEGSRARSQLWNSALEHAAGCSMVNTYPRPFGLDQLVGGQLSAMSLPLTGLGEPCDHLLICMSKRLIRPTCLFGRWGRD